MSDFLSTVLPSAPQPPAFVDPRVLLLYSDLKVGKSTIAAKLSQRGDTLWLDYEDGGEMHARGAYVNVIKKAVELKMKRIDFLLKLWSELAESKRFKFVIHDKIDNLEEWAERWATVLYKSTIIGRNFQGSTVLELAEGGGYLYLRERFNDLWNGAVKAAQHSIFMATIKTKFVGKGDQMVSSGDLDLTGKIRKIAVGFADATGYMYRGEDGANWVSFVSSEKGAYSGNRIARLEGKKIRLSWRDEKGDVVVGGWKELFSAAGEGGQQV